VFHIVLHEPKIPPNTGNVIRTSAVTGAHLHLVEPLGFSMDDTKLKRAGLDYHDLAHVTVQPNLDAAFAAVPGARVYAFTTHATTRHSDIEYRPGDVLLFGTEPTGLPADVLADPRITTTVRIPMLAGRRSLNLSASVAIAVYEAWRQHGYEGAV
jgi:tRNA (cytidine/uridine-2'-O-)-methyltransferase